MATDPIIPFNRPYFSGREAYHVSVAAAQGHISGNGIFTQKCQQFFSQKYGFPFPLLTTSGTDALEMAALIAGIGPGDEVILPSFTFVSTANAFALRGARLVFADSLPDHPNIDLNHAAGLITPRTRALVVVHYGGMACQMDLALSLAEKHGLLLIEDAAHAIDASYQGKPLGSLGDLAAFSFHETKNISCGEGGMLCVNKQELQKKAEITWEKGTDRAAFKRGEVDKYTWRELGSSYLPSDMAAAFLYGQLENLDKIQSKRRHIYQLYGQYLKPLMDAGLCSLPIMPKDAVGNGHLFYLTCQDSNTREKLRQFLLQSGIQAVTHYVPLHSSPYMEQLQSVTPALPQADHWAATLLRLPFYYDLTEEQIQSVADKTAEFFGTKQ